MSGRGARSSPWPEEPDRYAAPSARGALFGLLCAALFWLTVAALLTWAP